MLKLLLHELLTISVYLSSYHLQYHPSRQSAGPLLRKLREQSWPPFHFQSRQTLDLNLKNAANRKRYEFRLALVLSFQNHSHCQLQPLLDQPMAGQRLLTDREQISGLLTLHLAMLELAGHRHNR